MSDKPAPAPADLHDLAQAIAIEAFTANPRIHADAVCVVAIKVTEPDNTETAFSGGAGYTKLCSDLGMDKKTEGHLITAAITTFLKSDTGGGFTDDQINRRGYDEHGRGAMNCAEPKMHHLLTSGERFSPANWALIPFHRNADSNVVYFPPCRNCRRWVYDVFHAVSQTIARNRGGEDCLT